MAGMFETGASGGAGGNAAFKKQLNKVYKWYTGGFFVFVVFVVILALSSLRRDQNSP